MSLGHVSLLFLLQAGLGSLLTFLVTDRRQLGPKYDKFGGWVVVALLGLAGSLVWGESFGAHASSADRTLGACLVVAAAAALAFSSLSGWDRPVLEKLALIVALFGSATALALASLRPAEAFHWTTTEQAWVLAASAGSSLVIGFTTWGMILGHWYLVAQQLPIHHLARLVKPLPWIFAAKTLISAAALWFMWERVLGPGNASLGEMMQRQPDRVLDVANVWGRIPVGLLVPAAMAMMTRVTVSMSKTQPATGILFAMCGTVYLGELMGAMLLGSVGVPL
jgi:hypothetical protein